MATFVAFLRAINLGKVRQFRKDDIAAATTAAGFTGVATHINTGNVRLETAMRSRAKIEAALEKAYLADRGFEVPTIVFSAAELRAVVADADRFSAEHDGPLARHYVSLLKNEMTPEETAALATFGVLGAACRVSGRAVHLLLTEASVEAAGGAGLDRRIGLNTSRNVTVVRAVAQKWC